MFSTTQLTAGYGPCWRIYCTTRHRLYYGSACQKAISVRILAIGFAKMCTAATSCFSSATPCAVLFFTMPGSLANSFTAFSNVWMETAWRKIHHSTAGWHTANAAILSVSRIVILPPPLFWVGSTVIQPPLVFLKLCQSFNKAHWLTCPVNS